jgi:hypothetical protein
VGKFNLLYGLNGTAGGADHFKKVMANYDSKKDFTDEDEVQQKSDDSNLIEKLGIEAEDLHGASKVVL